MNLKHGHGSNKLGRSPTFITWMNMIQRCKNPKNPGYPDYGGRGIVVCDRWLESFENFLDDMGTRLPGATLDRFPDKDGNYEPGNCRWATAKEQANNRRRAFTTKLSALDMDHIRILVDQGWMQTTVARLFGVSLPRVNDLVHRRQRL